VVSSTVSRACQRIAAYIECCMSQTCLCANARQWRQKAYGGVFLTRHYVVGGGQLHALAALPPGKSPRDPIAVLDDVEK
jgi:hypothetical protein